MMARRTEVSPIVEAEALAFARQEIAHLCQRHRMWLRTKARLASSLSGEAG